MVSLAPLEVLLPELRAYARSLCEQPDTAEDLVQDSIERSLKSPSRPRALCALRPWMFRVIRNLHHDEQRKRRVRREYVAMAGRLHPDAQVTPDHSRDTLLRLGYGTLPRDKREVLFLVDIMGLKYREAARVMGVADGTVMSRLSRARQALRDRVETGPEIGGGGSARSQE